MPSFYEKPLFRYPIYALIALSIITILISFYFNWILGTVEVSRWQLFCFLLSVLILLFDKRLMLIFLRCPTG